jgi:uncharacterized protein YpmS
VRFFILLFGIVLGVAGTLAYSVLANPPEPVPAAQALPADPPMTVTLGESFLTALVRRGTPPTTGVSVPPTALRTEVRDDAIVVHANVDVLGKMTSGTAVLRPVLRDGHLKIEVVETNLGDLSIPAMEQVLEQQIDARLKSLLDGMPVTITGVKLERGRGLIVTCNVDLDRMERQAAAARTVR